MPEVLGSNLSTFMLDRRVTGFLNRPSASSVTGSKIEGATMGPVVFSYYDVRSYNDMLDLLFPYIQPGEQVSDDIPVGVIRSALHPDTFSIRTTDRNMIGGQLRPGKSATVLWGDRDPDMLAPFALGRPAKPNDQVFETTPIDLMSAGFHTLYDPTQRNGLHVQLVHNEHMEDPDAPDLSLAARKALARVLGGRNRMH
jgi:hypothetical protein